MVWCSILGDSCCWSTQERDALGLRCAICMLDQLTSWSDSINLSIPTFSSCARRPPVFLSSLWTFYKSSYRYSSIEAWIASSILFMASVPSWLAVAEFWKINPTSRLSIDWLIWSIVLASDGYEMNSYGNGYTLQYLPRLAQCKRQSLGHLQSSLSEPWVLPIVLLSKVVDCLLERGEARTAWSQSQQCNSSLLCSKQQSRPL